MLPKDLLNVFTKNNMGPFIGVPCSILAPLIDEIINEKNLIYINACNEGEALSIASGMNLCDTLPVVLLQNSGLGNLVNPITSLLHPYKIGCFLCISVRGFRGKDDQPQHNFMGGITERLLDLLGIKYAFLESNNYNEVIKDLVTYAIENKKPVALLITKGILEKLSVADKNIETKCNYLKQTDVLDLILEKFKDSIMVSTTGKISRELFYLNKNKHNSKKIFYMYGSMGCVNSIALGISQIKKNERIVVVDADGALLMKLGNLSTIGSMKPNKFTHIVIDNESYLSTGGQPSNSQTTHLEKVALNCGYDQVYRTSNYEELVKILDDVKSSNSLTMVLVKTSISIPEVARADKSIDSIVADFKDCLNKI